MSTCNIDHSNSDVRKKLEEQKAFLPKDLYEQSSDCLNKQPSQSVLNELFHLLKKYDLSSQEEQQNRNHSLQQLIQNNLS